MIGGCVYAEISCNAAVSGSVSANPADVEAHILDLLRTALHDGVGIRTCQRDSVSAVYLRHDLGVGSAGDCDAGDRVSRKSLRDPDACGEACGAGGSNGGVFEGDSILKMEQRRIILSAAVF